MDNPPGAKNASLSGTEDAHIIVADSNTPAVIAIPLWTFKFIAVVVVLSLAFLIISALAGCRVTWIPFELICGRAEFTFGAFDARYSDEQAFKGVEAPEDGFLLLRAGGTVDSYVEVKVQKVSGGEWISVAFEHINGHTNASSITVPISRGTSWRLEVGPLAPSELKIYWMPIELSRSAR